MPEKEVFHVIKILFREASIFLQTFALVPKHSKDFISFEKNNWFRSHGEKFVHML